MDKELKTKWVNALLSGAYQQGAECLHMDGKYCCLGVLHKELTGRDPGALWGSNEDDERAQDALGKERKVVARELADLNDSGVPFDMIAGLIDSAL